MDEDSLLFDDDAALGEALADVVNSDPDPAPEPEPARKQITKKAVPEAPWKSQYNAAVQVVYEPLELCMGVLLVEGMPRHAQLPPEFRRKEGDATSWQAQYKRLTKRAESSSSHAHPKSLAERCLIVVAACLAAEAAGTALITAAKGEGNDEFVLTNEQARMVGWRQSVGSLPLDMKERLMSFLIRHHILDDDSFAHCIPTGVESVDLSGAVKLTQHSLHRLVEACPSLTSLNLTGCWFIEAQSLVELSSKVGRNLVSLTLDQLELDSRDLEKILAPCTRLRDLSLRELQVANIPCARVSEATYWEKACRQETDQPAWTWLHRLKSLERLVITHVLAPTSVAVDVGHCTNLTSLHLESCVYTAYNISSTLIAPIFTSLTRLREWDMSGWLSLVDGRLRGNLQVFGATLVSLSLCGTSYLTGKGVKEIANLCPNLLSLNLRSLFCNLRHTPEEVQEAVTAIGTQCTALTYLNISHCTCLPRKLLPTAVATSTSQTGRRAFPSLLRLDIQGTAIASRSIFDSPTPADVTEALRTEVLDAVPSLEELWLSWDPQMLDEARWTLPTLREIRVHVL